MYMDPSFYTTKEFESLTLHMGLKVGLVAMILTYIICKMYQTITLWIIKKKYANEEIKLKGTFSVWGALLANFFTAFYVGMNILPFYIFPNLEYMEINFGYIETINRTTLPWHITVTVILICYFLVLGSSIIILTNRRLILFDNFNYLEFLPGDIQDIYVKKYSENAGGYYNTHLRIFLVDKTGKKFCLGAYILLKEFYTTIKKTLKRRKIKNE